MSGYGTPTKQQRAEVEIRRTNVAAMYARRWPLHSIAEELGITHSTVWNDVRFLRNEWREKRMNDIEAYVWEEIERIDATEHEAWRAWERSQKDAEETRQETGGKDGGKTVHVSRGQVGDPRFLEIVHKCVDKRARLLGLYQDKEQKDADPEQVGPVRLVVIREVSRGDEEQAKSKEPWRVMPPQANGNGDRPA